MNYVEDLVLLLRFYAQRSKSLACTAVRADKSNIIHPGYCRPFCEDLTAFWTRHLNSIIFHSLTTFQGRTAEAVRYAANLQAAFPLRFFVRNSLAVANSAPIRPRRLSHVLIANFGFSCCCGLELAVF